jgi:hypothetical protein
MPAARVNLHLGLYSCDDGAGASLWCLSADPRLWCERRLSVISHIACVLRPTSLTLAAADTGTMKNASLRPLLLLATSVGVCAALFTGCSFWRLGEARALTSASEVFEQHPSNATLRLLVVGDSTAVGTGASSPAGSVAGLLGSRYPKLWVDNGARDGAKFDEVPAQVATANNAEGYDVVLICAGGNDVMRGTDIHALRAAVERSFFVAKAALKAGGLVLVQPAMVCAMSVCTKTRRKTRLLSAMTCMLVTVCIPTMPAMPCGGTNCWRSLTWDSDWRRPNNRVKAQRSTLGEPSFFTPTPHPHA